MRSHEDPGLAASQAGSWLWLHVALSARARKVRARAHVEISKASILMLPFLAPVFLLFSCPFLLYILKPLSTRVTASNGIKERLEMCLI